MIDKDFKHLAIEESEKVVDIMKECGVCMDHQQERLLDVQVQSAFFAGISAGIESARKVYTGGGDLNAKSQ